MKLTMGKMIVIWVTCMVLGLSMTSLAKAACDPDECGFGGCAVDEQCTAKCCVPKTGGGDITCFPAGTKVRMGEGSEKNIEDVKVGDKVVSEDEAGNRSVSTVTELDQPIREHMCQINFENGQHLQLTNEHPLMTQDGWKSISPDKTKEENPDLITKPITIGDNIVREDRVESIVRDFACWSKSTPAYNLILDGTARTYFADGYLAHNKGGDCNNANCPLGTRVGSSCTNRRVDPYSCCLGSSNDGRISCSKGDPGDWWLRVCNCVPICTSAVPSAMTLSSPDNDVASATADVILTWNTPANWGTGCPQNNQYYLYVGTNNPPTNVYYIGGESVLSRTFTGTRGTTYYWYVRAYNGSIGASSEVRSFRILDNQITGKVFFDTNNNCGGSEFTQGGASVSLDEGASTAVVDSAGNYSLAATLASEGVLHRLTLNIPTGYSCSSAPGCNTCSRSGITSPSSGSGNNFYITDLRESWWQAEGAGIYSGGEVRSILPSTSFRLIVAPVGGTAAALIQASGNLGLGVGELSDPAWMANSKYKGKMMGYDYFAARMGVVRGQPGDWVSDNIELPTYNSEKSFWYASPTSTTATINTPWVVRSNEKYVIFVNGDLQINADVTVEDGGFLAFIVKGNTSGGITVGPDVTSLEGLYVTDKDFETETVYLLNVINDVTLQFEGSVVAWGTMSLNRNLGAGNTASPAEKFTYRPDLLANMPDKMKVFAMQWQEVVAGSFE